MMRQFLTYDFQKLKPLVSGLAKLAGDVFLWANCPLTRKQQMKNLEDHI